MGRLDDFFGKMLPDELTSTKMGPDGKPVRVADSNKIRQTTEDLKRIRHRISADRLPKEKFDLPDAEKKLYPIAKKQNYLAKFNGAVNPGEILIVGYCDDSSIVVMRGAKLKIIGGASNLKVTKEAGAIVEIAEMDTSVSIEEKKAESKNCPNCGAPRTEPGKCLYCGS